VTLALAWSGGKDSALALRSLRAAGTEPDALLTTVTEGYERVSMHGIRIALLETQARAAGLPLVQVRIPPRCPDEVYDARMAAVAPRFDAVAFGDLFLEDVRAYREERLARAGARALFPLWGEDTAVLARRFLVDGFRATLCCVDPRRLDASFAGSSFDPDALPAGVDPCGENGEFHTFVHAGPVFAAPIEVEVGERVDRDGFVFCDLT
jgi:uncharacterized protein (TIGR00290 family)